MHLLFYFILLFKAREKILLEKYSNIIIRMEKHVPT